MFYYDSTRQKWIDLERDIEKYWSGCAQHAAELNSSKEVFARSELQSHQECGCKWCVGFLSVVGGQFQDVLFVGHG